MARELVPGQRGQQASGAGVMSGTAGTIVIMVGAVLLFALGGGSPSWLNLRVVGLILIMTGVLGLAVPRFARSRGGWFRRWVVPMSSGQQAGPQGGSELIRTPGVDGDTPTLADDLLRLESDPPA
jgi:hypothetical protein